jgi:hypothetical protein
METVSLETHRIECSDGVYTTDNDNVDQHIKINIHSTRAHSFSFLRSDMLERVKS